MQTTYEYMYVYYSIMRKLSNGFPAAIKLICPLAATAKEMQNISRKTVREKLQSVVDNPCVRQIAASDGKPWHLGLTDANLHVIGFYFSPVLVRSNSRAPVKEGGFHPWPQQQGNAKCLRKIKSSVVAFSVGGRRP